MSSNDAKVQQMQRHFGGQVDAEVLAAVLDMCAGDVRAAQAFLEAEGNGPAVSFQELQQQSTSLPNTYPAQGARTVAEWQAAVAAKQARSIQQQQQQQQQQQSADLQSPFVLLRELIEHDPRLQLLVEAPPLELLAVVVSSIQNGVEFAKPAKAKLLACAWARRDYSFANYLLASPGFGLAEVLKAAKLLDGLRVCRALEARLAKLRDDPNVKDARRSKLRLLINEAQQDPPFGSLPGSLKKRIRAWVRTHVSAADLLLQAMGMPTTLWKELADIVHLGPGDFALDWFFAYVFSGVLPDGEAKRFTTLVATPRSESDNVALLLELKIPYVAVRAKMAALGFAHGVPLALRAHIASYETLETLVWHYEDLACSETNAAIQRLLGEKAPLPLALGKLLERAIVLPAHLRPALINVAEAKLRTLSLPLASPVVVMGDASNSMDVAIRVSTILAGLCCNLCDASLRFFNDKPVTPSSLPHSAAAIVDMAMTTKASGLTACAAGLHEFYINKTYVKTFVLVSDEIENEQFKGEWFPTLFQKYRAEVNPDVQLALVSFRDSVNLGRIHSALLRMNIDVIALSLSADRPDSSRVDALLALLAQHSSGWSELLARTCLTVKNEINSGRAAGSPVDLVRRELSRSAPAEPAPSVGAAAAAPAVADAGNHDDDDDDADSTCVVCEDREVEIACAPCGHFVLCGPCSAKVTECPMCRQAIANKIKIFKK